MYGLAGGYGRGEGAFSEAPFFRADRDSGKPTVINQLLGRIRHEKAKLAAEKGESVREQSHAHGTSATAPALEGVFPGAPPPRSGCSLWTLPRYPQRVAFSTLFAGPPAPAAVLRSW